MGCLSVVEDKKGSRKWCCAPVFGQHCQCFNGKNVMRNTRFMHSELFDLVLPTLFLLNKWRWRRLNMFWNIPHVPSICNPSTWGQPEIHCPKFCARVAESMAFGWKWVIRLCLFSSVYPLMAFWSFRSLSPEWTSERRSLAQKKNRVPKRPHPHFLGQLHWPKESEPFAGF